MNKLDISWDKVWEDCLKIVKMIQTEGYMPGLVIGIARGGLIPAAMIARQLGVPMVSIGPTEDVRFFGPGCLVVDDIFDSGKTLNDVYTEENRHVTLYDKDYLVEYPSRPDWTVIEGNARWVVFPWESEDNG